MHADEHSPDSAAASWEHTLTSASRDSAVRLRTLVDDMLRAVPATTHDDASFTATGVGRDPLRELCAVARASDVRPETLILAIKAGWRRVPRSLGTSRREAEATLARVITRCIKEYYGPRPP